MVLNTFVAVGRDGFARGSAERRPGESKMSRRPLRTHGRRFALGLSLLLVAGAIAVPAFATVAGPRSFTGEVVSPPEFLEGPGGEAARPRVGDNSFRFTVNISNTSTDDVLIGSANVTVPSGITSLNPAPYKLAKKNVQVIEYRSLKIRPLESQAFTFTGSVDCTVLGNTQNLGGSQVFDVVAKSSADFSGRSYLDLSWEGAGTILNSTLCPADVDTEIEGIGGTSLNFPGPVTDYYQSYQVFGPNELGGDDPQYATAREINTDCQGLLTTGGSQRLSNTLYLLIPRTDTEGFVDLTLFLTADYVKSAPPPSAKRFEMCFAGEKYANEVLVPGEYEDPYLLPDCAKGGPPCVISRTMDSEKNVEILFRLPLIDPWLK
jgi:hypothetical protein